MIDSYKNIITIGFRINLLKAQTILRKKTGISHQQEFKLNKVSEKLQMSLFDDNLLFLHSDFISGQFDIIDSTFSVSVEGPIMTFECASSNNQTITQRWYMPSIEAKTLTDFLKLIGISITPIEKTKTKESHDLLNTTTICGNAATIDLTLKSPDILFRIKTDFCLTLINRDQVGINILKHNRTHLEFHLMNCGQTYQKWMMIESDFAPMKKYFRNMGFPVPDNPITS